MIWVHLILGWLPQTWKNYLFRKPWLHFWLPYFVGSAHLEMQLLWAYFSYFSTCSAVNFPVASCITWNFPPRSCRCLAIHLQTFLPRPAEMESSCEDPRQTWWSIWAFKKITKNFWYAPQEFVHHNKYVYVYKHLFRKYNKHAPLTHLYIIYRIHYLRVRSVKPNLGPSKVDRTLLKKTTFQCWKTLKGSIILTNATKTCCKTIYQVLPSDLFGGLKWLSQGLSDLNLGNLKATRWGKLLNTPPTLRLVSCSPDISASDKDSACLNIREFLEILKMKHVGRVNLRRTGVIILPTQTMHY